MSNQLLPTIADNLLKFSSRTAFCIQERAYTYQDFSDCVSGISQALQERRIPEQTPVGIATADRLETYASIFALWFNRLVFVPLSPANPAERNRNMIEQTGIKHILAFDQAEAAIVNANAGDESIETRGLVSQHPTSPKESSREDDMLYILFTSGSTGTPKGVPITRKNLDAFVRAFFQIGYELNEQDRFLQIFDFTFDVSVQSYVLPLYLGAGVYTVPQEGVKFLAALKVLKEHRVTFAKLVPSTLQFFKPYFGRIELPHLRYSLFSGEALPEDITREWARCIPNAVIENHYGPTEGTIDCLYHRWKADETLAYNGIVAIGELYDGMEALVVGPDGQAMESGQKGELWISGDQVTEGYWKNPAKNRESFAIRDGKRYYKTGDIVFQDIQGRFLFCGRKDNQLQIQGYRVELGEVEHHVKQVVGRNVVLDSYVEKGVLSLVLFVEGMAEGEKEQIEASLRKKLPHYMIPGKIVSVGAFPRTVSGKTDRGGLRGLL
ncbi:MAG: AMP-binding protein [Lewinellaceae bacterium]|nr:AMP-binding protein [Phaeodactylibacter sp.]MCB9038819.1 AMP-binding protein [Lewinellaceae bacterium]